MKVLLYGSAEGVNSEFSNKWNFIKANEPLATDRFISDVVIKKLEKTISENIQIVKEFIHQVRNIESGCI